MVQLCPQIGCSGVLHVETEDIGRVLRCKKCGSPVRVEERGLVLLSAPPPNPSERSTEREDDPAPRAEPVRDTEEYQESAPMPYDQPAQGSVLSALFAWLFSVGMIVVLVFLFLPLLDQASVVRQSARIEGGEREQKRLDDKLWGRGFDFKDKAEPPAEEAIKARETQRKDWERRRESLQEDLESSRIGARGRHYFYSWGMLIGFVLLAIASMGFLTYGPTSARRVVGAVVLSAEVLLIFLGHLISSTAIAFMRPF